MKSSRGFTTIELLIVITIMAVLVALAIPSFADFFEKGRLRGAAEMVYEQLMYAKGQAIKRSKPIVVDFYVDSTNATAWIIGITDDPSGCDALVSSTPADSQPDGIEDNDGCTLSYDNDLGTDHPGIPTPSDLVLMRIDGTNNHKIQLKGKTSSEPSFAGSPGSCSTANAEEACFEPIRGENRYGTVVLTSPNYELNVIVGDPDNNSIVSGIRVCVPTGKPAFAGYPDC